MYEDKLTQLNNILSLFVKDHSKTYIYKPELYHYTRLSTLYDILENDSLWFFNSRFSNDYSEEKLVGDKWLNDHNYNGNNFIFCICGENDTLSQWRGYCNNGGVSIALDVRRPREYCILHNDYDKSDKYKNIYSMAIPVLYSPVSCEIIEEIERKLKDNKSLKSLLHINDFVPYVKHEKFSEEQEFRLLFSNSNEELNNCICFRNLQNGTRIPYIVVKFDNKKIKKHMIITEKKINKIINDRIFPNRIIIPICSNQDEVCNLVRNYIKKNPEITAENTRKLKVFCEGHLPIRSITIAPMFDQDRIKEQIYHFCQSKYWLKDVEIRVSEIPYVSSINS